jgi:hypothetical protein
MRKNKKYLLIMRKNKKYLLIMRKNKKFIRKFLGISIFRFLSHFPETIVHAVYLIFNRYISVNLFRRKK